MSRKHAELEREFIDELANRTGRSLDAWMGEIDEAGLTDRNAIIDWLRPQGLTFAHASWLERIHHNGGRPIYLGNGTQPGSPTQPATQLTPQLATQPSQSPARQPLPTNAIAASAERPAPPIQNSPRFKSDAQPPTSAPPNPPRVSDAADAVGTLLAKGKGLRPLADKLLREITRALPGSTITAAGDLVLLANPSVFACVHIGAKELRLGLSLEGMNPAPPALPVRIPGAPAGISHMMVLNDARQLDDHLAKLVILANAKASPT